MPDGSLVFDTKIDTTGAENGIAKLRVKLVKATSDVQKQTAEVQRLEAEMKRLQTTQVPTAQYAQLQASMQKADGQLQSLIDRQEKYLATGGQTKGSYWEKLQYDIEAVAAKVREYQAQMAAMENNGTAFATDSAGIAQVSQQLDDANLKLDEMKVKATDAGTALTKAATAPSPAVKQLNSHFDNFNKRLGNTIKSALIFSVMYKGLSALRDYMGQALSTNQAFQNSLYGLKSALLTAFSPILSACVPALITLMNVLAAVIMDIATFFAMLGGKSLNIVKASTAAVKKEGGAISGAGSAAKDAAKSMANFDEINQLSDNSSGGGSGGGNGGGGAGGLTPDLSALDTASDKFRVIKDIVEAIGAALLTWKIASIFTDKLSLIWGLALAIGGAILMIKGYWDAWKNGVSTSNLIEIFAGLAAVATGLGLAFGPVAAGIALVVGGIAALVLAFKDITTNGVNAQNTLLLIGGVIAAGLGISILTGSWIPLLIAGVAAALLAVVSATGNMDKLMGGVKDIVGGVVKFVQGIASGDWKMAWEGLTQIVAGARTVIVTILESLKQGFSMAMDALVEKLGLTGTSFDTIIQGVKQMFSGLIDFVTGVITGNWDLALSGLKNIAEGFRTAVAGSFDLLKQVIFGTLDAIVQKLGLTGPKFTEFVNNLKQIFGGIIDFLKGVFTANWTAAWNGLANALRGSANIMISAFESAINHIVSAVNKLISAINSISSKVGIPAIPTIPSVRVPRLAQGAVIPPNRQFLAVLGDQTNGTNVEAPLSTIQQAVLEALAQSGGTGGSRDITIILELDHTEFGRAVYHANNEETQRVGMKLAV